MAPENLHSNAESTEKKPDESNGSLRSPSTTSSGPEIRDLELRFREALVLWLRWNEAYEQATAQLFSTGMSPMKIEDFMDSMDQLRREAISLSHSLLD